jgi:hypothetical protein
VYEIRASEDKKTILFAPDGSRLSKEDITNSHLQFKKTSQFYNFSPVTDGDWHESDTCRIIQQIIRPT